MTHSTTDAERSTCITVASYYSDSGAGTDMLIAILILIDWLVTSISWMWDQQSSADPSTLTRGSEPPRSSQHTHTQPK